MKYDDIFLKVLLGILGFVAGMATFALKVDAKASAWQHDKPYFQEEMRELRQDVKQLLNEVSAIRAGMRHGRGD